MAVDDGIVVIGGGAAADSFVHEYRAANGSERVTMITDDGRAPYFRPSLTKELLRRETDERNIGLDDPWYAQGHVDLRLRAHVSAIDLDRQTVTTPDGPIGFDTLVVATGSSAAELPVPGADSPLVHRVRSLADTRRLLSAPDGPVVVVGSGFIGCEAAWSMHVQGRPVTVLSNEAAPQAVRLGDAVGRLIGGWLADSGIRVVGGVEVERIDSTADGVAVHTSSSASPVDAALVVIATGSRPNLDLLDSIGLAGRSGAPADSRMRTSAAGVFAIGDIAHAENTTAGRRLRVEHWGDAVRMGAVAAHVLAGQDDRWGEVPGFWSSFCDHELKYAAWGDGWDQVVEHRSSSGVTFWYGRDDRIVGVLTDGHDEDHERASHLVATAAPLPATRPGV